MYVNPLGIVCLTRSEAEVLIEKRAAERLSPEKIARLLKQHRMKGKRHGK